ncbi:MAG: CvpA family protein [Candidatus Latescibacterota bacterium]
MSHWIDLILGGIIFVFALRGWRRGLIHGLVDGIGFVVGLLLAITYMRTGVTWMDSLIHLPAKLAAIVSFLGIFLIVVLTCRVGGMLVRSVLHLTPAGLVDSGTGALLGGGKGVLLASLALMLFALTPLSEETTEQMKASALAGPIGRVAPFVFDQANRCFPRGRDFYNEIQECLGSEEGASVQSIIESW